MNLASEWRLTLDPDGTPRVIVDFDDEISAELDQKLRNGCRVVPIIESAPFLQPDESHTYSFEITVYKYDALDKDGRASAMDGLVSRANWPRAPLRVEVNGYESVCYWEYETAFVTEFSTVYEIENNRPCHARKYSVVATGLTKTTL